MADGAHGFSIAIEINALVSKNKIGLTWFGDYRLLSYDNTSTINIQVILYQGYDVWKNHKANCNQNCTP